MSFTGQKTGYIGVDLKTFGAHVWYLKPVRAIRDISRTADRRYIRQEVEIWVARISDLRRGGPQRPVRRSGDVTIGGEDPR